MKLRKFNRSGSVAQYAWTESSLSMTNVAQKEVSPQNARPLSQLQRSLVVVMDVYSGRRETTVQRARHSGKGWQGPR